MTIATLILAVVTIAFPREGARLPALTRCYVIGATEAGSTNIVIQGRSVPVFRTGAWGTVVEVAPGTNVVEVGSMRRTFYVAAPDPDEKPTVVSTNSIAVAPKASAKPRKTVQPSKSTYTKLPYAADEPKPHPNGKEPRDITVVVDAGHGGKDSGAVGPLGTCEKNLNLAMAKAVEIALTNRGFRVVMTRRDDSFPQLYDRPKVAHRENADAFVSIHYNAPAYDRDPTQLRFFATYAWNQIGERLGKAINDRMNKARPGVRNNGVIHANFAVTRNPEIPSCLIEVDFITSPEGEADALNARIRANIAESIAEGVSDWAKLKDDDAEPLNKDKENMNEQT